jgi:hypothetical protein
VCGSNFLSAQTLEVAATDSATIKKKLPKKRLEDFPAGGFLDAGPERPDRLAGSASRAGWDVRPPPHLLLRTLFSANFFPFFFFQPSLSPPQPKAVIFLHLPPNTHQQ